MFQPHRSRNGAPPPYTQNVPENPFPSSSRGDTINENREPLITSTSSPGKRRAKTARRLARTMHPSLPNEQSSLLNANVRVGVYQTIPESPRRKKATSIPVIITLISLNLLTVILYIYFYTALPRDELDPVARERVRKEWNKEIQNHQNFMKHVESVRLNWALETKEHEKQRSVMVIERQSWQQEKEERERRLNDERRSWQQEKEERERKLNNERRSWQEEKEVQEKNLKELHQTIDRDRRDWEIEKRDREIEWQRRQKEYEKEMERKRQREDAERRRREDEERKRAGMRWDDLFPDQKCLSYGTREYTAKLVGIPRGQDRLSVCRQTEAEIHGKSLKPNSCEERGYNEVWAKWVISFQEPTCTTWWSNFADKGCLAPGSHTRRFEQRLDNIQSGDDWKVMCTTTPTDFREHHFDSPTACANWGKYGVYGYWDINDSSC